MFKMSAFGVSTQALRRRCHWSMASSTARCSSPHHTVIRRCRSSSMSWTLVWYTRCCMTDQRWHSQSAGLRFGELGSHMSGGMNSGVLRYSSSVMSHARCAILLESEHVSRNTSYCRQKFLQKNIPVILSVNLRSCGSTNISSVHPKFWY